METILKTSDFQWIDIINPSFDELSQVAVQYGLHTTSVQDCLDTEHLPKFEKIGDVIFVITRVFDGDASADADTMQELTRKIALFIHDQFVISIHRKDQPELAALRKKWADAVATFNSSNKPMTSHELRAHILCDILSLVFTSYEKPLDAAVIKQEHLERQIFKKGSISILEEGYFLKRKASVFKRMLRMLRDIVAKIDDNNRKTSPLYQDTKETGDALYFYCDELDENVNQLLNLHLAMDSARTNEASHRTNEVMRVLTIFSLFFMPLNLIVGIYGMNFEHLPGLKNPNGYPLVLVAMLIISFVIFLWFRKKGWLQRRDL